MDNTYNVLQDNLEDAKSLMEDMIRSIKKRMRREKVKEFSKINTIKIRGVKANFHYHLDRVIDYERIRKT
jgi:hypothetical protein